jgi:hypothetical protein
MRKARYLSLSVAIAMFCFGSGASCRRDPPSSKAYSTLSAESPLEVARALHNLHEQREYGKIAQRIVEEDRARLMRLLIALDDTIDANVTLRRTAESAFSGPQEECWDLAAMQNNLGIFSRDVKFISMAYRGEIGEVTLQQGSAVPLVHVEFVQEGGQWLLRPEPTPDTLPEALHELTRILREVEHDVACGTSINAYADAFFYRVVPQMHRVMTTVETPRPAVARSADE